MRILLLFLIIFYSSGKSNAQCTAKEGELKVSQLSSEQTILDKGISNQIDKVIQYLISKYKTPLKYYYKSNWNNACYDPNDNHLYFGTKLLNDLHTTGGISAIAFVVCHEYSNFCQNIFPNGNSLVNGTVRIHELQADFLASYFFSDLVSHNIIEFNEDQNMMGLVQAIYDLGDNNFTDESHHGTPVERTITT